MLSAKARLWMMLVVATLLLGGGCVEVDGGALEVRWDFRDSHGARVGCDGARAAVGLTGLRLSAIALSGQANSGSDASPFADGHGGGDASAAVDLCAVGDRCTFACDTAGDDVLLGVTPFFLPEGRYLIRSLGLDQSGGILTAAKGVVAPSPVVRQVNRGEVADLNVNLIIVSP